jgi:hypothetical protein
MKEQKMSLQTDSQVDEHVDDTITISREFVDGLIQEMKDFLYMDRTDSIIKVYGPDHPFTRLAQTFNCD